MIRRLGNRLQQALAPGCCSLCQAPARDPFPSLCRPCLDSLPRISSPHCGRCGLAFDGAMTSGEDFACPHCSELDFAFDRARAALAPSEHARRMVHLLKYERRLPFARDLGAFTADVIRELGATGDPKNAAILPVPLHRSRRRWRGFNHAALIGRYASQQTGIPLLQALTRTRKTPPQVKLTRKERLKNLRGAFALREKYRDRLPSTIYLLDDVFTTGATANECSRVLRKAGHSGNIYVVTPLRG